MYSFKYYKFKLDKEECNIRMSIVIIVDNVICHKDIKRLERYINDLKLDLYHNDFSIGWRGIGKYVTYYKVLYSKFYNVIYRCGGDITCIFH